MTEWRDLPLQPEGTFDLPVDRLAAQPASRPETGPEPEVAAAGETVDATAANETADGRPASCPWCATPTPTGATRCPSCDAALAQRETIGDLVIPGLTTVDPALRDYAQRPLHISGPSPSQGLASGAIVAAAAGGPIGLAIIGGIGAVAAAEYLGANRGPGATAIGDTSDAVRLALERLERGEALPAADETTPRPELAGNPGETTREETTDGR